MRKLDYESWVPQATRADLPSAGDIVLWLVCCFVAASAGVGVMMVVAGSLDGKPGFDFGEALVVLGVCGVTGSGLTFVAAAPLLVFVKSRRWRLVTSALLGFVMTAGLFALLWLTGDR